MPTLNPPTFYRNAAGTFPALDTWVDDFSEWAMANLHLYYVGGLKGTSTVHNGSWVEYEWGGNSGVYCERPLASLEDLVYEWLRANQLTMSTHFVREGLARLRSKVYVEVQEFDPYTPDDPYVVCESGVWYPLTRELAPHTPDVLVMNKIPCRFVYSPSQQADPIARMKQDFETLVQLESRMPCWMDMRKHYPRQIDFIERYCQMIIYRDIIHKIAVYVVGGSNTGKGTVGHVLGKMFDSVASYQPMSELNEKWGLMPLIGKLVNFDFDSGMGYLSKLGMGRLKTIIGDPGKPYSTPIIYAGAKDVVFSPFFFTFSNQLQILPANVDRKAWGKRALCLIMDRVFEDNLDFEREIMKEIDVLFTYLCLKPYYPIQREEFGSFEEFVTRNLRIWDVWSDPVRKVLLECFERSYELEDIYMVEDVERVILEILDDREIEPGKNYASAIKKTLKRLGVTQRNRKVMGVKNNVYIGVRVKYLPPGLPKIYPVHFYETRKEHGVSFDDLEAAQFMRREPEPEMEVEVIRPITPHEVEEEPKPVESAKTFFPAEGTLTYKANHADPIFAQILSLTKVYEHYRLVMDDIFDPLYTSGVVHDKGEIRTYVQEMEKSGLLKKDELTKRWYYVGELP